jgi:hypothetical protein
MNRKLDQVQLQGENFSGAARANTKQHIVRLYWFRRNVKLMTSRLLRHVPNKLELFLVGFFVFPETLPSRLKQSKVTASYGQVIPASKMASGIMCSNRVQLGTCAVPALR